MGIAIAGIFLFIVVAEVVQTFAGVAFWKFGNSLAGVEFLQPVVSKYVDVRNK